MENFKDSVRRLFFNSLDLFERSCKKLDIVKYLQSIKTFKHFELWKMLFDFFSRKMILLNLVHLYSSSTDPIAAAAAAETRS